MIKPVAGGGGIGMQTVREEVRLRDALARARRVATAAFGDERLLLERLVERARHVEVQILADEHGNVASVGDRDCSAQRRHQKIVEEAPAPIGDDKRRERMAAAEGNTRVARDRRVNHPIRRCEGAMGQTQLAARHSPPLQLRGE